VLYCMQLTCTMVLMQTYNAKRIVIAVQLLCGAREVHTSAKCLSMYHTTHTSDQQQCIMFNPRCNQVKVLVASCKELLKLVAYVDFS
jgi:hypothetical protein